MTSTVLLYPSDPLSRRSPEGGTPRSTRRPRRPEAVGLRCALLSSGDFDAGRVVARPAHPDGGRVLYRGWMLRVRAYAALEEGVGAAGAEMITTAADYERCHHLPGWLDRCRDFTAETVVVADPAERLAVLAELSWPAYFVKDFVKSLTTRRGSIARSAGEVLEVVDLLAKYRGSLEGGVCLRAVEEYVAGSEERYFAVRGSVRARRHDPTGHGAGSRGAPGRALRQHRRGAARGRHAAPGGGGGRPGVGQEIVGPAELRAGAPGGGRGIGFSR